MVHCNAALNISQYM